jgi:hypothetical protein
MIVIIIQLFNKIKLLILLMLFVYLVLHFSSCNDTSTGFNEDEEDANEPPRTSIPAQLVGNWYSGNISGINFFNATTGQWGAPSGTGIFFKFTQDGYYEKGTLLQSSLYGCSTSFLAYNKGTMSVEGNMIVLYPTYGRIKSIDNCVAENNYEKSDQLQQEKIIWHVSLDEYGSEVLMMSYEDSNPSAFYRR